MEKNVAVAPAESFDWSGFYMGGNIGGILSNYEFGEFTDTVNLIQQFEGSSGTDSITPVPESDGGFEGLADFHPPLHHAERRGAPIGGGQIGFNKQWGHLVFGVEGDFDRTSSRGAAKFKDSDSDFLGNSSILGNTDVTVSRLTQLDWTSSARLRLGWAWNRFLFYATGGATWGGVTAWANDSARTEFFRLPEVAVSQQQPFTPFLGSDTATNSSRDDDVLFGWTAGAGAEIAVSDTVSLALEYRHSDFGDTTFHFSPHGGPIFPGSTNVSLDSDQVTFRMNVLLCHLFGREHYASTTANNENIAIGYTRAEKLSAKDKNIAVAPPEEPFTWTGFYFGANVGGMWNNFDFDRFNSDVDVAQQLAQSGILTQFVSDSPARVARGPSVLTFTTPGQDGGSSDSVTGGGQLGYNQQFGHFLIGIEGDLGGTSTSSRTAEFSSTQGTNFFSGGFSAESTLTTRRDATVNWTGSGRGRLGWADGRLLLYLTGGVAFADVSVFSRDSANTDFFVANAISATEVAQAQVIGRFVGSTSNLSRSQSDDVLVGWTAGGGAEWAMNQIVSLGLEYRHNDFGDSSFHIGSRGPITSAATNASLEGDQVTFRVNFLLGNVHSR